MNLKSLNSEKDVNLTVFEISIVWFLMTGMSVSNIADWLSTTPVLVNSRIKKILKKIDAEHHSHLVIWFLKNRESILKLNCLEYLILMRRCRR